MGSPLRAIPPVDVAFSVLDQTPPNTAGPTGRLTSLVNGQITKYLPATATPGVATGARVKIEQREAFRAMTNVIRSNVTAGVITPAWTPPELLDSLGNQLVSINDAQPRVFNGTNWTGYPNSRVLTQTLSQSTLHTVNGIIQASDDAWLGGVTCSVWTQIGTGGITTSYVGFKGDNGAWVRTPAVLQVAASTSLTAVVKVVSDGSKFFVFAVRHLSSDLITCFVFDTTGTTLGNVNVSMPTVTAANQYAYWDVTATPTTGGYTTLLAIPTTIGSTTGITTTAFGWNGSAVISNTHADTTVVSDSAVSFLTNDTGNGLSYLATFQLSGGSGALRIYEITNQAQTHLYNTTVTSGDASLVDSVIGWAIVNGGNIDIDFAVSKLAPVAGYATGPKFSPRLRNMTTYKITSGGTLTTIKSEISVVAVSRAFKVDDDYYAVTYYQGGPGIIANASASPVTWTSGDFMKGPAVQPLNFAPGDFQYGNVASIGRQVGGTGANDIVIISGAVTTYIFYAPGQPLNSLNTAYLTKIYAAAGTNGKITIAGASNSGNNGAFTLTGIQIGLNAMIVTVATTTQVAESFGSAVTATLTAPASSPDLRDTWLLGGFLYAIPDNSWQGEQLVVAGTSQPANFGSGTINTGGVASLGGGTYLIKLATSTLLPEVIPNPVQPTASLSLQLTDSTTAYEFFIQGVTFDQSYIGVTISVKGTAINANNTVYQISQVIDAHHVIAMPLNVSSNQINHLFENTSTVTLGFPTQVDTALQQTWFLTPLAISGQHTAGRWEYGLAYADWRFDGASLQFSNTFPWAVASVVHNSTGVQVVLPYRSESFSAGVTAASGIPVDTFFSTIGLKVFTLATQTGQSLAVGGELIIPGPQASEFTASGFAEHGINLGPEQPFLISQTNDGTIPFGLTPGTQYQYRATFEFTDEDGDRIYTIPSPALNVNFAAGNNTCTVAGNMPGPINRLVSIALYRTSLAGGSTTIQHYKLTNDTDPNGAGFTFPDIYTWNFKDQRPDVEILESEVLYVDKGFLPRYPAPAFSQGVGTWRGRTWVIGYDGAIWMSGEKTEGDAVWFHPAFRFTLPSDDSPTCLAPLDDYLIVLGGASAWYVPSAVFPDATGNNGQLPDPVQMPFANGGTGWAVTTRDGVIYSSTAGGVWLISRSLTNGWLSQAIQSSLGLAGIAGIAIDKFQRVLITTGGQGCYVWDTIPGAWYQWPLPSVATLVNTYQGNFVYADGTQIMAHVPGSYADNIGGSDLAIPVSWTLAPLHLLGSVRGYGRCWAFQLQGEYKGPHLMGLTLGYGDESDYQAPTVYPPTLASPTLSYLYEWNPREEEASQFEISFAVTFPAGVTGNSATWELISFDVGVDTGIARIASQKRIS